MRDIDQPCRIPSSVLGEYYISSPDQPIHRIYWLVRWGRGYIAWYKYPPCIWEQEVSPWDGNDPRAVAAVGKKAFQIQILRKFDVVVKVASRTCPESFGHHSTWSERDTSNRTINFVLYSETFVKIHITHCETLPYEPFRPSLWCE